MILPGTPPQERDNELAVAASYRAEAAAFFAAAREPGRTADEAADLRGSGADLRALAQSIERGARGLPGLPPRGLVGA
jgi:hypothetical protein